MHRDCHLLRADDVGKIKADIIVSRAGLVVIHVEPDIAVFGKLFSVGGIGNIDAGKPTRAELRHLVAVAPTDVANIGRLSRLHCGQFGFRGFYRRIGNGNDLLLVGNGDRYFFFDNRRISAAVRAVGSTDGSPGGITACAREHRRREEQGREDCK